MLLVDLAHPAFANEGIYGVAADMGLIDHPHAASTELADDLIRAEPRTGRQGHERGNCSPDSVQRVALRQS